MNDISKMCEILKHEFPDAVLKLDPPLYVDGVWALDIFLSDYHLAVAWKDGKGFGLVANEDHGYGEGADEVFTDLTGATLRALELLRTFADELSLF